MEELTIDDVLAIAELVTGIEHTVLVRMTRLGPLDSALHAPFADYGDKDIYLEPWRKCAVLGSRIVRNHPFPDGNKRVAFLAMLSFARLNGATWKPEDDAGPIVEQVAAGDLEEDDFAQWVREGWNVGPLTGVYATNELDELRAEWD